MKELLNYILKSILGKDSKFEIEEVNEESVVKLIVKTSEEEGGMVIGKGGKIIKAIRNLLRVKATLEHKKILLLVNPTE